MKPTPTPHSRQVIKFDSENPLEPCGVLSNEPTWRRGATDRLLNWVLLAYKNSAGGPELESQIKHPIYSREVLLKNLYQYALHCPYCACLCSPCYGRSSELAGCLLLDNVGNVGDYDTQLPGPDPQGGPGADLDELLKNLGETLDNLLDAGVGI